jgi:phospholipid/cholesterol/gamma-HCH transport system permease protein
MIRRGATLAWVRVWGRAALLALAVAAAGLSRASYTPHARSVTLQQIYFTAWQVLIRFTLFAALLGLVVVQITLSVASDFGLADYALELALRVLVLEVIPLLTALFVALRSGAAINTEVALMQMSGELDDMRAKGLDPLEREFLPRMLATAISVAALTVLGCGLVLVTAYLAMYGFSPWGFDEYSRTIARVFDLPALAGFALKCLAFGLAVAVIPVAAGTEATRQMRSAPVAVMGGMVRLFFALGLIEVLALAVKYV